MRSELAEGSKTGCQVFYFHVIAHLLREFITGSLEGKRLGRYAIIRINNSKVPAINKNKFLPLIGLCRPKRLSIVLGEVFRMVFNQSNNRRLLPTHIPSLIREGSNLVSHFTFHSSLKSKLAFTLAEVLITLGIIGIVAALTMPALIDNHNKKVVEARLEKFYSSMNQAIRMAELDYGPREYWFEDNSDRTLQEEWCKKYIIPYMNVTKTGLVNQGGSSGGSAFFTIFFADGSAVSMALGNGRDWLFFPGNINKLCFFILL